MNSLTEEVAQFAASVTLDEIPAGVVDLAKRSILDGLGLAVAGARTDVAQIARGCVDGYGTTSNTSSVLGTTDRLPARFAAFLNGIAIHADDYDDTQLAVAPDRVYGLLTHPTAPALASTLAVAERDGATGADLLLAYLIAVEVETKIAEAINPRHYDHGFHSTATMGAIGAGAGAGRLLGLSTDVMRTALSISASQAAGLRESFGTMTKPFHAGRAAESGVFAAELAAAGLTSAQNILEAKRGFFSAAGGGYAPEMISGKLGNPWTFADPGVSIKPHPSGSLTHPAMTAMMRLIEANDIRPEQVVAVYVGTNRHMPNALIYPHPTTDLEAKFSMQFCMAILLLRRRAGLAEYLDEVVLDPEVQQMIDKVQFVVDPEAESAGYDSMQSIVRVTLTGGRTFEERCEHSRGNPHNPMTDAELVAKFADCLAAGENTSDVPGVVSLVLDLEHQPSVNSIVTALTRTPAGENQLASVR